MRVISIEKESTDLTVLMEEFLAFKDEQKVSALESAEGYLVYMAFSPSGLIEQLEYEGFTHDGGYHP